MKVLIVDDSDSWVTFHKNAIEEIFIELDVTDYRIDIAYSARDGYDFLLQNNDKPYDLIISDLQMEEDFSPKYAGEWFVEQIKTFKKYLNTSVVICSGCYNIKQIAENLSVNYIPKRIAVTNINEYKEKLIILIK
ncbi:MAG: response regulator [Candidatus Gastranaerophilales bacterium]|nr:response regulator [Candidatus Gastranaerophilales bacterium]